ncbi:amidohydrolase family protein [Azorhizobium doebereinerae]|uniref:amidohydrolase family protein n=1 Tax=Azorhizobium doebereinerae TaxID=281091 RepID=UPI00040CFBAC|nr:amidohydrolase family protein [Azorhizobium doebereinerae]
MQNATEISKPSQSGARSGIIDANMHWLPETLFSDERLLEAFLSAPPREYGIHAELRPVPGDTIRQIVIEQPKGYEVLNYAQDQYDRSRQIADMDAAGIERAIFRLPCWQEWLDLDTCKIVNDGLARHVRSNPDRFSALAVAPPWGGRESIREVERCLNELGFVGVQMAVHYGQLYLDDAAFKPYLRVLNDLGVPVVVHHTPLPVDYASIVPYTNQRRQYGRCVAQATAVGRELFSGMFDEFPNLTFVHSMLGGGFFAYVEMLFPPKLAAFRDEVDRFEAEAQRLRQQLTRNIYFDMSGAPQWGKAQLECAVKVLGAQNILYGGSYPIRRDWFLQGVDYVKSLGLPAEDQKAILGGNAKRIFKLP